MGPSAFRVADVDQRMRALGYEVEDLGDLDVAIRETQRPAIRASSTSSEIRATCEALRDRVGAGARERAARRSCWAATTRSRWARSRVSRASIASAASRIGLDLVRRARRHNTPETSPSGNIHGMPLAVALGLGVPD